MIFTFKRWLEAEAYSRRRQALFNFCKRMQKIENRLCPLPYEEVLEDTYTAMGRPK